MLHLGPTCRRTTALLLLFALLAPATSLLSQTASDAEDSAAAAPAPPQANPPADLQSQLHANRLTLNTNLGILTLDGSVSAIPHGDEVELRADRLTLKPDQAIVADKDSALPKPEPLAQRPASQPPRTGRFMIGAGTDSRNGVVGEIVFDQPSTSKPAPLPKLPDTLDEMLATALRSNPDILLAEAKLRQAQAELNQTQLKVTEQVGKLYHERHKQERLRTELAEQLATVQQRYKAGNIGPDKVLEVTLAQAQAEAALPQLDAQARYLLGAGGQLPSRQEPQETAKAPKPPRRPPIPEPFRKILDQSTRLEFANTPLQEVLDFIAEAHGLKFLVHPQARLDQRGPVSLSLQNVPLRAALLALADQYDICFVFRDYGILVADPGFASSFYGATIPPHVALDPSVVPPDARGD